MNELLVDGDLRTEVQVTSVGQTRKQAQWMARRVSEELTADALQTAGWTGRRIQLVEIESGDAVERDDDVQPPVFYAIDSYSVYSTPAP